ncbi:MAG: cytochrome c oxidase subunit II [Chloroflexota bacterium]|jgi:cytochrome c oxidase subunit 2
MKHYKSTNLHSRTGRKYSRIFGLPLATLAAVLLAGCQEVPAAIFLPVSPSATAIHDLSLVLLAIAAVVLVVIEALLFIAIVRFRNRPESEVEQTHGNLPLEIGWTVATSLAVILVMVLTVKTMGEATATSTSVLPSTSAWPNDEMHLRAVGYQWWWYFEYPQLGIVTANEAHVPLEKPVKLQLEAADVIHSFWVPRLGGKLDMIPGTVNYSSFVAIQSGIYEGVCAEFCGVQHARMAFRVIVDPTARFSSWIREQQQPATKPVTEEQKAGEQLFLQSCGGCHTVRGTQASGKTGPDLTHVASRLKIAAGTIDNTPEQMARWLRDPQEIKPGNLMPASRLDAAAIDQLVAYLENLR